MDDLFECVDAPELRYIRKQSENMDLLLKGVYDAGLDAGSTVHNNWFKITAQEAIERGFTHTVETVLTGTPKEHQKTYIVTPITNESKGRVARVCELDNIKLGSCFIA